MPKTKNRDVLVDEIASVLPINTWFDKLEFSDLTGISVRSSQTRLTQLTNDGLLDRKGGNGYKGYWLMTEEMKEGMIKKGCDNRLRQRNRKKKAIDCEAKDCRTWQDKLVFSAVWV